MRTKVFRVEIEEFGVYEDGTESDCSTVSDIPVKAKTAGRARRFASRHRKELGIARNEAVRAAWLSSEVEV